MLDSSAPSPRDTELEKLLALPSQAQSWLWGRGKRGFDLVAAGTGLLFVWPVLVVVGIAVKWSDGGPVFYRHDRVGRRGVRFRMWKFRTMDTDADKRGGPLTAAGDPRLTATGRWLRRYKLDELAQLFNVLRGEMSFVGPRPEAPLFVDPAQLLWKAVLRVRPGITDLATLTHRYEEALLDVPEDPKRFYRQTLLPRKLRLSVETMRRACFWFDLKLVFCTVVWSFAPLRPESTAALPGWLGLRHGPWGLRPSDPLSNEEAL